MVALLCYLNLRGPLGWRERCAGGLAMSGGVRLPHRFPGVWGERPLGVVLRGDTHLTVDGGTADGGAWRFLVWEWTRLRRLMKLLRVVSVALAVG